MVAADHEAAPGGTHEVGGHRGRGNPITRKPHLDDRYLPRTVRHSNAVVRAFYEFWIERGEGPLVNPVPQERSNGQRPNTHHNPLEPFRPQGRLRYNSPVPKRRPRVISDQRWQELFVALRSDRTAPSSRSWSVTAAFEDAALRAEAPEPAPPGEAAQRSLRVVDHP